MSNQTILARLILALTQTPGQHVWALAEVLGISGFELAEHRNRNLGDDVVRRILLRAQRDGIVTSVKTNNRRLWFVATPVVTVRDAEPTLVAVYAAA